MSPEAHCDSLSTHRLPGHNAQVPISAGLAYLVVIFTLKWAMKERKAFELKAACTIHNGVLALFSLVVFVAQTSEAIMAAQVHL